MFRIKKKFLVVVFTIAVSLIIVIPALAAYIGPNRSYTTTETTIERVLDPSKDQWQITHNTMGLCLINHYCTSHPSVIRQNELCGFPLVSTGLDRNSQCEPGYSDVTVITTVNHTHPSATVSGSLSCSTAGSNGWCLDGATVSISGSEPISGQSIIGIEGTLDSTPFYQGGSSTSFGVSAGGSHGVEYWALSTWGDSSSKGSMIVKIDNDIPTISGNISGSVGDNGWYVSNVTATASGGDNDSGVDTQQVQVDGGGFANNSSVISSDGNHSVLFKVTDNAGRTVSTSSTDFKIDKTAPSVALTSHGVNIQTNGTLNMSGTASDATSGLAGIELSLDGGGSWISVGASNTWSFSWDTTATVDGTYAIELKATDNAGHVTQLSGWSILVDNTPPTLTYDVSGTQGSNSWYIGDATLTVSGTDATSGLDKAEIKIDSGGWVANADSITTDGSYSVTFQTTDNVGNTASQTVTVNRDTVDPTFTLNKGNNIIGSGQINFSGTANDATSGIGSIKISFDNGNTWQTVTAVTNWKYDWDTRSQVNGDYKLKFIVVDKAGHTISQGTWIVTVDNNLPQVVMSGACINNWETLDFSVNKGNLNIGKTTLTILGRTYENPSSPFVWDQRDSTGKYIDTPGDYPVTLTAYDSANNSTTSTGCITIHAPLAVVTSSTPTTPAVSGDSGTDGQDSGSGGDTVAEAEPTQTPVPLSVTPSNNLKQSGEITTTATLKVGKAQQEDVVAAPPTFQSFVANAAQQFQQQSTAANAPLWGNAALAAAAIATAFAMSQTQKRKEKEAIMEARAKASQARYQDIKKAAEARYAQRQAASEARKLAMAAQLTGTGGKLLQKPTSPFPLGMDADAIKARLAAGGIVSDIEMEYLEHDRAEHSAKFKHGMEAWEEDQERIQAAMDALENTSAYTNGGVISDNEFDAKETKLAATSAAYQAKMDTWLGSGGKPLVQKEELPWWKRMVIIGAEGIIRASIAAKTILPHIPGPIGRLGHLYDLKPDYRGLAIATEIVPQNEFISVNGVNTSFHIDSTTVAASIAIQSEWMVPQSKWMSPVNRVLSWIDQRNVVTSWRDSGIGYAQVSDAQMQRDILDSDGNYNIPAGYSLPDIDQMTDDGAITAMATRIGLVVEVLDAKCTQCTNHDYVIAVAKAQNAGFDATTMASLINGNTGTLDWQNYDNWYTGPSDPIAKYREKLMGLRFDTDFMLKSFINNLRVLHSEGWDLPRGLTLEDLDEIESSIFQDDD